MNNLKPSKSILVSVIVATYDEQEHISNCISSLLNQSYPKVEIVITDDGSTDKTVEIIDKFAEKYPNIKLVKQNHLGMAPAWNNSFKHSKGEIVIIAAADMVFGRKFIKDLVRPIIEEGAPCSRPVTEKILNADNLWARVREKITIYTDTVYAAMRRDVWIKAGGADTRRGYDADRSFYDALKIKPVAVDVEIYHHHPASFKEFWKQSIWIGRSMKLKNKIIMLLVIPLLPLIILFRSLQKFVKDPTPAFILFLPFYNLLKYTAFLIGIFQYFINGKKVR